MRTADAVKLMVLMADAKVMAMVDEYRRRMFDPMLSQMVREIERLERRRLISRLLYGPECYITR